LKKIGVNRWEIASQSRTTPYHQAVCNTGSRAKARWFDPREGKIIEIGEFENKNFKTFTPPTSGMGQDWILLIDDLSSSLPGIFLPTTGQIMKMDGQLSMMSKNTSCPKQFCKVTL
jgi:hypothetical protein